MKNQGLLITVAILLTGWLAGCTTALSPEARIEYRRSGGLAGMDDLLAVQESGEAVLTRRSARYEFILDGAEVGRMDALFDQAAFSQLRGEYLPSRQGNDLIEYVVTYKGHRVRTMDGAVPAALQPILQELNQIVEGRGSP